MTDHTGPIVICSYGFLGAKGVRRYFRDSGELQRQWAQADNQIFNAMTHSDGKITFSYGNGVIYAHGDNPDNHVTYHLMPTTNMRFDGNNETGEVYAYAWHSSDVNARFLRKLNPDQETAAWTVDEQREITFIQVLPDGNVLIAVRQDGSVFHWRCFNPAGGELWEIPRPSFHRMHRRSPTPGYVYYTTASRTTLKRFESATGVIDPTYELQVGPSNPNGLTYMLSDGRIFQRHDGMSRWRLFDPNMVELWDVPVPQSMNVMEDYDDEGCLYVSDWRRLGRLDADDGTLLWSVETPDDIQFAYVDRIYGATARLRYPSGRFVSVKPMVPAEIEVVASPGVETNTPTLQRYSAMYGSLMYTLGGFTYDAEAGRWRIEWDLSPHDDATETMWMWPAATPTAGYWYGHNHALARLFWFPGEYRSIGHVALSEGFEPGLLDAMRQDPDDGLSTLTEFDPEPLSPDRFILAGFVSSRELELSDDPDSQVIRARLAWVGDTTVAPPVLTPELWRSDRGADKLVKTWPPVTVDNTSPAVVELPFRASDLDAGRDPWQPKRAGRELSIGLRFALAPEEIPGGVEGVPATHIEQVYGFHALTVEQRLAIVNQDPDAPSPDWMTANIETDNGLRILRTFDPRELDPTQGHTSRWRMRKNATNGPDVNIYLRVIFRSGNFSNLVSQQVHLFTGAINADGAGELVIGRTWDFSELSYAGNPMPADAEIYGVREEISSTHGGGGPAARGSLELAGTRFDGHFAAWNHYPSGPAIGGVRWAPIPYHDPVGETVLAAIPMAAAGALELEPRRSRLATLPLSAAGSLELGAHHGQAAAHLPATAMLEASALRAATATAMLEASAQLVALGARALGGATAHLPATAALRSRGAVTSHLNLDHIFRPGGIDGDFAPTAPPLRELTGYFGQLDWSRSRRLDHAGAVRIVSTEGRGIITVTDAHRLVRLYERGEAFIITEPAEWAGRRAIFHPDLPPRFVAATPDGALQYVDIALLVEP